MTRRRWWGRLRPAICAGDWAGRGEANRGRVAMAWIFAGQVDSRRHSEIITVSRFRFPFDSPYPEMQRCPHSTRS
jgi:hypothetical protein